MKNRIILPYYLNIPYALTILYLINHCLRFPCYEACIEYLSIFPLVPFIALFQCNGRNRLLTYWSWWLNWIKMDGFTCFVKANFCSYRHPVPRVMQILESYFFFCLLCSLLFLSWKTVPYSLWGGLLISCSVLIVCLIVSPQLDWLLLSRTFIVSDHSTKFIKFMHESKLG